MKTTTFKPRDSISCAPCRLALLLIPFALACFALSSAALAVCQEGCDVSSENTFLGDSALVSNTTGVSNTAIGDSALAFNTTGSRNTATGDNALFLNTTGNDNTASGFEALANNTTGNNNTATGVNALLNNTGSSNTANGYQALYSNTTGGNNTASGYQALYSNTTGAGNTANGFQALFNNTAGNNTASGNQALFNNTTGTANTATGLAALFFNSTGTSNTAYGYDALLNNTTGGSNIALGYQAGINLTTGNNNIDIGNAGVAGEARRIRIGTAGTQTRTFIAGIRGVTTQNANAIPVLIDSAGQLGTVSSSRRFKKEIKPMDQTSEAILGLKPVTFHYKSDSKGTPQFGLIAEEVAKVNPDLVVRDENGEIYTVRYDAVNAMLLNEFLKEHRTVQQQEATITELTSTIAQQRKNFEATIAQLRSTEAKQQKQIEALATGLQKVADQLEVSKPAGHLLANE